jgi:TatD DNase family protein
LPSWTISWWKRRPPGWGSKLLIDSHAHIDLPEFNKDRDQVLERARAQGVRAVVNVGLDAASSRRALEMVKKYDDVFMAVGFHPHEASKMKEGDLESLADLSKDMRVVAIGEIGLDFYRNLSPGETQVEVFKKQLDLAVELKLPVVVHSRQAHKEVYDILSTWAKAIPDNKWRGVIHCFSGDVDLARRYIELGFYISLAGSVTYPSAGELVKVAGEVPLDRLLLETDCPFLAPQAYRGKRNEPAYMVHTAGRVAEARQAPLEAVAEAAAQNTIELFRLPLS